MRNNLFGLLIGEHFRGQDRAVYALCFGDDL